MTPGTLRNYGQALYGPEWQTPLGDALGVSDRTIRRWVSGECRIPPNVASELTALVEAQARATQAAAIPGFSARIYRD